MGSFHVGVTTLKPAVKHLAVVMLGLLPALALAQYYSNVAPNGGEVPYAGDFATRNAMGRAGSDMVTPGGPIGCAPGYHWAPNPIGLGACLPDTGGPTTRYDCAAGFLQWNVGNAICGASVGQTSSGGSINLTSTSGNPGSAIYACDNGHWTGPTNPTCTSTQRVLGCTGGVYDYGACRFNYPSATNGQSFSVAPVNGTTGTLSGTCSNGAWINVNASCNTGGQVTCPGVPSGRTLWQVGVNECQSNASTNPYPVGTYTLTNDLPGLTGTLGMRCVDGGNGQGVWRELSRDCRPTNTSCAAQAVTWPTSTGELCEANVPRSPDGSIQPVRDSTSPIIGDAIFTCRNSVWEGPTNATCTKPPGRCEAQAVGWTGSGTECSGTLPQSFQEGKLVTIPATSTRYTGSGSGAIIGTLTAQCRSDGNGGLRWVQTGSSCVGGNAPTCASGSISWDGGRCYGTAPQTAAGTTGLNIADVGGQGGSAVVSCGATGVWKIDSATCGTPTGNCPSTDLTWYGATASDLCSARAPAGFLGDSRTLTNVLAGTTGQLGITCDGMKWRLDSKTCESSLKTCEFTQGETFTGLSIGTANATDYASQTGVTWTLYGRLGPAAKSGRSQVMWYSAYFANPLDIRTLFCEPGATTADVEAFRASNPGNWDYQMFTSNSSDPGYASVGNIYVMQAMTNHPNMRPELVRHNAVVIPNSEIPWNWRLDQAGFFSLTFNVRDPR